MDADRRQDPDDDAAWAAVVARWRDDDAHLAYLARHPGLDGLADAGRRYKAALDRAPGDPVALRWRDEVLRRATALALAQLPAARPRAPERRGVLYVGVFVVVAILAAVALRVLGVGVAR